MYSKEKQYHLGNVDIIISPLISIFAFSQCYVYIHIFFIFSENNKDLCKTNLGLTLVTDNLGFLATVFCYCKLMFSHERKLYAILALQHIVFKMYSIYPSTVVHK